MATDPVIRRQENHARIANVIRTFLSSVEMRRFIAEVEEMMPSDATEAFEQKLFELTGTKKIEEAEKKTA